MPDRSDRLTWWLCGLLCVLDAAAVGSKPPTASFFAVGDLPGGAFHSEARGISADGAIVSGTSIIDEHGRTEAFRWTPGGGIEGLGDFRGGAFRSTATRISADGSTIVGSGSSGSGIEAQRWTRAGGMETLGDLPSGIFSSGANAVSGDGSVVVGEGQAVLGPRAWLRAWRWSLGQTAMEDLGDLDGGLISSSAADVSRDGTIIVGQGSSEGGPEAFRWTEGTGMQPLGDLKGGAFQSAANAISDDGRVIVGSSASRDGPEAFRWTSKKGLTGLGDLPGGAFSSSALDTSCDGSVIVGRGSVASGDAAFIWDAKNGMRELQKLLVDSHGLDLAQWRLTAATATSGDGRTIAGIGIDPQGHTEAWVAVLRGADSDGAHSASRCP